MTTASLDPASGQLIVDARPFLVRGVELHNSSSSSAEYLRTRWQEFVDVGANTVLAPISWELIEPQEGVFDLHLVDELLQGARSHGLKLVPLWFGSWKNGSSSYTPRWVKLDPDRFPVQTTADGAPYDSLSPFSDSNREADATAFAALMRHLRAVDHDHTVIMVQVENEVGLLGAARSYGPDAVQAWSSRVPEPLAAQLRRGASPYVSAPDGIPAPAWGDLDGDPDRVSELFMAWHYASAVEHVAVAGVAEYGAPVFVNAWLDAGVPDPDPDLPPVSGGQRPGEYPSGGPLPHVDVAWKHAAPTLGFTSPDIYFGDFDLEFARFAACNRTLFVPEIRADKQGVSTFFSAIGRHGAIGLAPFGIESLGDEDSAQLRLVYRQLAALEQEILAAQVDGRLHGFRVVSGERRTVSLGGYDFAVRTHPAASDGTPFGSGILLQLDASTFLTAGYAFALEPLPRDGAPVAVLEADELVAHGSELSRRRRLNGDESHGGKRILTTEGITRFSVYARRAAAS